MSAHLSNFEGVWKPKYHGHDTNILGVTSMLGNNSLTIDVPGPLFARMLLSGIKRSSCCVRLAETWKCCTKMSMTFTTSTQTQQKRRGNVIGWILCPDPALPASSSPPAMLGLSWGGQCLWHWIVSSAFFYYRDTTTAPDYCEPWSMVPYHKMINRHPLYIKSWSKLVMRVLRVDRLSDWLMTIHP